MQNKSVTALVLPTDPRDPFDVISARTAGNEKHVVDGVDVRVYGVAKTIADCFKYRNKIGIDVAIEALTECWCSRACSADSIWRYAAVCRVTNVIRPVSRDSDRRRRPRMSDECARGMSRESPSNGRLPTGLAAWAFGFTASPRRGHSRYQNAYEGIAAR